MKKVLIVLILLIASATHAGAICIRMKTTDTLTLDGHRQRHPERFVECSIGHWPNVDSVFVKIPQKTRI